MSKNSVVKKFDALVSKYGFDQGDLLDMYDIEEERSLIEQTLCLIPDAHFEHRTRKDLETEAGDLTAYGVVAVKCIHLMFWCLACFDSAETVLAGQRADREARLRKCSLAYEVYWHFNSDFLLRSVMNNAFEASLLVTPFFRNAHTFEHPDLEVVSYHAMLKVVSEIANLLFQYAGELPKKNKAGLKPWLLATQTPSHGWQLPTQGRSLKLLNHREVQVIQGSTFSIVLSYGEASLALGDMAKMMGGDITVIHQGKVIYSGAHSFAIDLDRNNAYTALIDRWYPMGSRWVSEVLMQETKYRSIAAHAEEIETLLLEACTNLLDIALNDGSALRLEIHEHLYSRELSWHHFNDSLFGRLRPEFLTHNLCAYAVSQNYDCLACLPEPARNDLRIGLAALKGNCFEYESTVWGLLFSHTEMPLEALAKAYVQDVGSDGYALLPLRLKTEEMRRYTVETHPDCLNYTTNPSVFSNREALEDFLEHQRPGLSQHVQMIMDTAGYSPRQAYESALASQEITVVSEPLPAFDFSDFGIPA